MEKNTNFEQRLILFYQYHFILVPIDMFILVSILEYENIFGPGSPLHLRPYIII